MFYSLFLQAYRLPELVVTCCKDNCTELQLGFPFSVCHLVFSHVQVYKLS